MDKITGAILLLVAAILYGHCDFGIVPGQIESNFMPWATCIVALIGCAYLVRSWFIPDNITVENINTKQNSSESESSRKS